MMPVEEILEALDLPIAKPGLGYLRSLFTRFNERVPFETASKILRDANVPDWADKPRRPEVFWADHVAAGAGGTCFARVAAFDGLLARLGFFSRVALGRVGADFDHAAVLVTLDGEQWICDVGFPLPALLPGAEGETETPLGSLSATSGGRGWRVELLGGVPEGPRKIEIFDAAVTPEEFLEHWRRTYRPDSKFLTAVSLRRDMEARTVSFASGEMRVDDLHSRTRIPLAPPRAPILGEQFGIDRELLERAFGLAGDPEPAIPCAEVSAYLEVDHSARSAFDAIASPEGYRRLMEGVAHVSHEERGNGNWRFRLVPLAAGPEKPQGEPIEEQVTPDPESLTLAVRREGRDSFYEAIRRDEKTFLVRRLPLAGPRLELLRNDSLRGRFAGTLAVDLLAWARLLGK